MFLALALFAAAGLFYAERKLTYTEHRSFNARNDAAAAADAEGDVIEQEFVMPYDVLDSVSVRIASVPEDGSGLRLSVREADGGRMVYAAEADADLLRDDSYFRFRAGTGRKVKKGGRYVFSVSAAEGAFSPFSLSASDGSVLEGASLRLSGAEIDGDLCFRIFGGDIDHWWHGFTVILLLYLAGMSAFACRARRKGDRPMQDKAFSAMCAGALVFLLLCVFSVGERFIDENDSLLGALAIADGGVLYRDFVTQHMPVMYYVCALFAKLGAGSAAQFRLSLYLFEAGLWVLLYLRHADRFGRWKMMLLPAAASVCGPAMMAAQGYQVVAERLQAVLICALLLEFIRYREDGKLGPGRDAVISLCVWGCFGSVFLSVYPLFFIFVSVLISEAALIRKNRITPRDAAGRYGMLAGFLSVPPLLTAVYFGMNHSLRRAFYLCYTFNTEVYSKYTDGLGTRLLQPVSDSIRNIFRVLAAPFSSVSTGAPSESVPLQFCVMLAAIVLLVLLFVRKKRAESLTLSVVLILLAPRDHGFHGLAAWYTAALIIVLFGDGITERRLKAGKAVFAALAVLLLVFYGIAAGKLRSHTAPRDVAEIETQAVLLSEEQDDRRVFVDAACFDAVYLWHKGRKPVNTALFLLPWYMDAFEAEDAALLREARPGIALFNEEMECWGYTDYAPDLTRALKDAYVRRGDKDWKLYVWVPRKSE